MPRPSGPSPEKETIVPPPLTGPSGSHWGRRLLRCKLCNAVRTPSPEELLKYTRTGWPTCCNQVMTLYVETDVPTPGDAGAERSPPRSTT